MKQQEIEPLIKGTGSILHPTGSKCKKRSIIIATIVLILFVLYLIAININSSSKFNFFLINNNENNDHIVGTNPFLNWDECDASIPPSIISYHLHVVFDGNNQESISFAYKQYHNFINYINPNMNECTFAHSYPSSSQQEICYFPTTWQETDFPMAKNAIFQQTNYAFFIPESYVQKAMTYFLQHHYDDTNDFSYVIHSISGCQINDHSKWLIKSNNFDGVLVGDNLLCCHNGPSLCTCNVVQYEMDDNSCLGIKFDEINNNPLFANVECENPSERSIGSWREIIYDETKNYFQIENYGDLVHPMYLCLGVEQDNVCEIGLEINLIDCSYNQDIEYDIWISKSTQFMYDVSSNQIQLLGCLNDNLCINVIQKDSSNDILGLTVSNCEDATIFSNRHFFP